MARTNYYVDPATGNDYKGASFTDGAYTSATKTLVKADAFTANLVNHWLKLSSNAGGSIVTGYYRIATRTDASTVILATDAGAGVDATDVKCTQADGTTTLPWHSVQGALDLITRDATNGDQINVKSGTTDTLTAALVFTTYGTPTEAAPLVLRGYTNAANDGGQGVISGNGTVGIITTGIVYTSLIDLRLTNTGNVSQPISLNTGGFLIRCRIDTSARNNQIVNNATACIGCQFDTLVAGTSVLVTNSSCYFCTFRGCNGVMSSSQNAIGCIFDCSYATGVKAMLRTTADSFVVLDNTIYGNGNTVSAITCGAAAGDTRHVIANNLVVGFSGAGGVGITTTDYAAFVGHNAFYNNTTPVALAGDHLLDLTSQDITLTADPFVSAATGDFRLTPAAILALRGQRFPETWPGLASMVDLGVIGAWQTAGGGGLMVNPGLSGGLR